MGKNGKITNNESFTRTMQTKYTFGYDSLVELTQEQFQKYNNISLSLA
jgi:hypothetical protein